MGKNMAILVVLLLAVAVAPGAEQALTGKYLLLGAFGKPGVYAWQEGTDMIKAIHQGEGLAASALLAETRIYRPTPDGNYQTILIDLTRLLGEADMSRNIPLLPGDIVFVPARFDPQSGGERYSTVRRQLLDSSTLRTNQSLRIIRRVPDAGNDTEGP